MPTGTRRADSRVRVHVLEGGALRERPDRVVTEEPMEIRVQGPGSEPKPLAVTMRTPGHDFELAVGLCHTEGILRGFDALAGVRYCVDGAGPQELNVVTVAVRHRVDLDAYRRALVVSASCGLCGTTTLDQVERDCAPLPPGPEVARSVLVDLPARLRTEQAVFDATGGLHAAGLFSASGEAVWVREDVGRHNAVDKLVGRGLLDGVLPLTETVLVVSGRVSFEIVQKAAMAGIPVLVAVSAPSSLAVAAARRLGLTVVGFVRDGRGNVYSHPERVSADR